MPDLCFKQDSVFILQGCSNPCPLFWRRNYIFQRCSLCQAFLRWEAELEGIQCLAHKPGRNPRLMKRSSHKAQWESWMEPKSKCWCLACCLWNKGQFCSPVRPAGSHQESSSSYQSLEIPIRTATLLFTQREMGAIEDFGTEEKRCLLPQYHVMSLKRYLGTYELLHTLWNIGIISRTKDKGILPYLLHSGLTFFPSLCLMSVPFSLLSVLARDIADS